MRHLRAIVASLAGLFTYAKLNGVNFVANGFESPVTYGDPDALVSLARLVNTTRSSYIQLSFPWYQASINSTGPIAPIVGGVPSGTALNNASSPSMADLAAVIAGAHAMGLDVILRPLVDLNWTDPSTRSNWRGQIGEHFNSSEWDAWFTSYSQYILGMAQFAAAHGCAGFCVGGELAATEGQVQHWTTLIAAVRAVFPGLVYYSATVSSYDSITWWSESDFIAVDVYPHLATPNPDDPAAVTLAELTQAWTPTVDALRNVSARFGKPVLVSETGICGLNSSGIYMDPAFYKCTPPYPTPIDVDVQTKYYESFFAALYQQDFVAGVFFWKWLTWSHDDDPGSPYNGNFSPAQHPAAAVMAQNFV